VITGKQQRAARALLGWGLEHLAELVGVNKDTLSSFENGNRYPRDHTIEKVIEVFAENGVEFTPDEGVKMRRGDLIKFDGVEGFKKFMDDIYLVAKNSTPEEQEAYPICCSNVDDKLYIDLLGDFMVEHIRRMTALKLKTRVHILIQDKPYSYRSEEVDWGYRQYRRYPENIKLVGDTIFYAYGRKLAILMLSGEGSPQIIVIDSPLAAKAYREQFFLTWQMAIPLEKAELVNLAKRNTENEERGNKKRKGGKA
jgi:transcriptional regulator with XRE-family HTH domain